MSRIYKNKKSGELYHVICTAIDCTNSRDGTKVVIYRKMFVYDEIFVREETEFLEKFTDTDL